MSNVVTIKPFVMTESSDSIKAARAFKSGNIIAVVSTQKQINLPNTRGRAGIGFVADSEFGSNEQLENVTRMIQIVDDKQVDLSNGDPRVEVLNLRIMGNVWRTVPISIIDTSNPTGHQKLIASSMIELPGAVRYIPRDVLVPIRGALSIRLVT